MQPDHPPGDEVNPSTRQPVNPSTRHDDPPVFEPPDWLDREEEVLAPYAMRTRQSRGRRHPEDGHPFRTLYQRDHDRIVHSTAFRRLMYKTHGLVNHTTHPHPPPLTPPLPLPHP